MVIENLTNPGNPPVEGDLIRITFDNGATAEKIFHHISESFAVDIARGKAFAKVRVLALRKIEAAALDLAGQIAGETFDASELDFAVDAIEDARDELFLKATVETLDAAETTLARNINRLRNYRRGVRSTVAKAKVYLAGLTDVATIEALDVETAPPWPTYPTWS